MKPAQRTDPELLAWAASIIQAEQQRGTHGHVRVELKAGRIVSVRTESTHLPPRRSEGEYLHHG